MFTRTQNIITAYFTLMGDPRVTGPTLALSCREREREMSQCFSEVSQANNRLRRRNQIRRAVLRNFHAL